jgi:Ca2+-binding RTX toxin-like protein
VAVGALLSPVASAQAAQITISSGTLTYQAAAGETNSVSVAPFFGRTYFTDSGAGSMSAPSPACTVVDSHHANCADASYTGITVNAGDGADQVDLTQVNQPVTLNGGDGDDVLTGGQGNDTLNGDAGNDTLRGTGGADTFSGGAGTDTVTYSGRTFGVSASIDGIANDGSPGESDNVLPDVENLVGTSGADALTGSDASNSLDGGPGNDTLAGAGGDDALIGGAGSDALAGGSGLDTATYADHVTPVTATLDGAANDGSIGENDAIAADVENLQGGPAADTLTGNAGANAIDGGAGNDTLDGGGGSDTLTGGDGGDTVAARDSAVDTITCGGGADVLTADRADVFGSDCEHTDLPLLLVAVPKLELPRVPLPVSLDATIKLPVACSAAATAACEGKVELTILEAAQARTARRWNCLMRSCRPPRHSSRAGSRRFRVAIGHIVSVPIHLGSYAQWALRHRGRLRVRATVYVKRGGHYVKVTSRTTSLRRPRVRRR